VGGNQLLVAGAVELAEAEEAEADKEEVGCSVVQQRRATLNLATSRFLSGRRRHRRQKQLHQPGSSDWVLPGDAPLVVAVVVVVVVLLPAQAFRRKILFGPSDAPKLVVNRLAVAVVVVVLRPRVVELSVQDLRRLEVEAVDGLKVVAVLVAELVAVLVGAVVDEGVEEVGSRSCGCSK